MLIVGILIGLVLGGVIALVFYGLGRAHAISYFQNRMASALSGQLEERIGRARAAGGMLVSDEEQPGCGCGTDHCAETPSA